MPFWSYTKNSIHEDSNTSHQDQQTKWFLWWCFQHAGGITGITENHLVFRWIVEQTNLQNRYHYEYLQGSRKICNPRSFVFHDVLHLHQKSSKEYLGFPRDPPLQLSLPLYVWWSRSVFHPAGHRTKHVVILAIAGLQSPLLPAPQPSQDSLARCRWTSLRGSSGRPREKNWFRV